MECAEVWNAEDGAITVFAVNRNLTEDACLVCDLRSLGNIARHIPYSNSSIRSNLCKNPSNLRTPIWEMGFHVNIIKKGVATTVGFTKSTDEFVAWLGDN